MSRIRGDNMPWNLGRVVYITGMHNARIQASNSAARLQKSEIWKPGVTAFFSIWFPGRNAGLLYSFAWNGDLRLPHSSRPCRQSASQQTGQSKLSCDEGVESQYLPPSTDLHVVEIYSNAIMVRKCQLLPTATIFHIKMLPLLFLLLLLLLLPSSSSSFVLSWQASVFFKGEMHVGHFLCTLPL